jgi:hypothetical protein
MCAHPRCARARFWTRTSCCGLRAKGGFTSEPKLRRAAALRCGVLRLFAIDHHSRTLEISGTRMTVSDMLMKRWTSASAPECSPRPRKLRNRVRAHVVGIAVPTCPESGLGYLQAISLTARISQSLNSCLLISPLLMGDKWKVPCSASQFVTAKITAVRHLRKLSETCALPLLSTWPHIHSLKDHRHLPGAPPASLPMPQFFASANPVQDGPKPTGLGVLLKRALCIEPTPWVETPPPRNVGKDYRDAFRTAERRAARCNAPG